MCVAAAMLLSAAASAADFDGVRSLVGRRAPWLSSRLELKQGEADPCGRVVLRSRGDTLVVEASDASAAAFGVGRYLKQWCRRSMSHMADNLSAPDSLPRLAQPVELRCSARLRHALNYCTLNYTMSFYTAADWERELDWMALNGVNMMLVATGMESVWRATLLRLGYTEAEADGFIPGPAYTAWWLMGNLEGQGGPMPLSQVESRREMTRGILARMRELGIEPVVPGFYGMVPSLHRSKSGAHIIEQGRWCGFTRPDIIDPADPEFDRVAAVFYDELRRAYGDSLRYFSGDPFHEGGATAGIDLADAGRRIQQAMRRGRPDAIWVLQGWQENPREELLAGLDRNHVVVQELFGESTANWESRRAYCSTPFIWGTVTNFGERPGLGGKLQRMADETHRAAESPYGAYMQGVGILPEGLDNNPAAYELLLELPWHNRHVDVADWADGFTDARYGSTSPDLREAWRILLLTVYSSDGARREGPAENVMCARPSLSPRCVSTWGGISKPYDTALFRRGVLSMARALPDYGAVRTYRVDLIRMLMQALSNRADSVIGDIAAAYEARDTTAFDRRTALFLDMIDAAERLLAHDPMFRLSTRCRQALDAGRTPEEKTNNMRNLMMLITYWGGNDRTNDDLHDYAYKEWAGMMNSFYGRRWQLWFDHLHADMHGITTPTPDFFTFDRHWAHRASTAPLPDDLPADTFAEAVARALRLI